MPPGEARGGMSYQQNDLVVDARMLLHQARTFFLQVGDFLIDIFDFMFDVIVVLAENFFRFLNIRSRWRQIGRAHV